MATAYKDFHNIIETTNLLSLLRQGYVETAELATASDSELEDNGLRPPEIRRLRRALYVLGQCPGPMSESLLKACCGEFVDALKNVGYATVEDLADAADTALADVGMNVPKSGGFGAT